MRVWRHGALPLPVLLAAAQVLLAFSTGVQAVVLNAGVKTKTRGDGNDEGRPPRINPTKQDLITAGHDAKVAGLKSAAEATEARIKTAWWEWSTSRYKAEELLVERWQDEQQLKENLSIIKRYSDQAVENSQQAAALKKRVEQELKEQVAEVKAATKKAVFEAMKKEYKALDAWREQVLVDPNIKARIAGQRAYGPYAEQVQKLYARYHEYMLSAGAFSGQADGLAADGAGLIAAGEGNGDKISGEQQIWKGNAMVAQAGILRGQAGAMESTAKGVLGTISQYLWHGQMAHWSAMHAANPDGVPPAPLDPSQAFVPK